MADYYTKFYQGIELEGKTLLDIGCGKGKAMKYAQEHGAELVLGIDPLYHQNNGLSILPIRIQDYDVDSQFDLIISHDSINHFDEKACILLPQNQSAWNRYLCIFKKIYCLLKDNGKLVIADASPSNFFADFGLKNVFDTTIEWHKHQEPEVWIELLEECGFVHPQVNWLAPRQLPDKIMGNKVVSYFMVSHFRLVMEK